MSGPINGTYLSVLYIYIYSDISLHNWLTVRIKTVTELLILQYNKLVIRPLDGAFG